MSRLACLSLLLVGWLCGCAQVAPRYDPFKIPKGDFYARIKVVALAPVAFAVNPEDPEAVKADFEALLQEKLGQLGFEVVGSNRYKEIWDRLVKQLGGLFDPITGKRDDAKLKTARGYLLEELRTRHRADALLHPIVQVVKAGFNAGYARWHGTTESVVPEGLWNKFLMGDAAGTTSALSLLVTIEDTNGVDLYIQAGGIQALAKLNSGRQFISIPNREVLTNKDRNRAAVDLALRALSKETAQERVEAAAP